MIKNRRYLINLYLNICQNQVNFRHVIRRSYHFFSFKMSHNFQLDTQDKYLNISKFVELVKFPLETDPFPVGGFVSVIKVLQSKIIFLNLKFLYLYLGL